MRSLSIRVVGGRYHFYLRPHIRINFLMKGESGIFEHLKGKNYWYSGVSTSWPPFWHLSTALGLGFNYSRGSSYNRCVPEISLERLTGVNLSPHKDGFITR